MLTVVENTREIQDKVLWEEHHFTDVYVVKHRDTGEVVLLTPHKDVGVGVTHGYYATVISADPSLTASYKVSKKTVANNLNIGLWMMVSCELVVGSKPLEPKDVYSPATLPSPTTPLQGGK